MRDRVRRGAQIDARSRVGEVVLASALLLAMSIGCAAPISVKQISAREAQRELAGNIISQGELSERTRILLRRANMEQRWRRDPVGVLAALHETATTATGTFDVELVAGLMDSMAELAFAHASDSREQRYFLAAALYAWVFLLPSDPAFAPSALERGVRLAADIYNRSIALAFMDRETGEVHFEDGDYPLPFGTLSLDFDESSVQLQGREISHFVSMADLEVRGLNNRYRRSGIGAPLAGRIVASSQEEEESGSTISRLRVSVTALLEFELPAGQRDRSDFIAELTVIPFSASDTVELRGRSIPLESEPSATLALQLTETPPWQREIAGFFQGDLALGRTGLLQLNPYRRERIPVVMVHGTASSIGRWADLINDLGSDPVLRRYYQVWLFQYNSGNPIAYSAWLLRKAIADLVAELDPEGEAAPLRDLVVLGHSQGGLLTKLLAVDSGDVFWNQISDRAPDEIDLSPESREILEGALFVEPSPYVTRVIFLSTPHRGSRLADLGPARLLGRMVRSPANLVVAAGDLFQDEPEVDVQRRLRRTGGAIGNMSPRSPFIQSLAEMPIAPGIASHSIIGVTGEPIEESSDGVVSYQSAHLPDVDSERVVRSGHSSQSNPEVVREVRRILIEHLERAIAEGAVVDQNRSLEQTPTP